MNQVTLHGRLANDPETSFSSNGMKLTRFTIAVPRETAHGEADFIYCTAFKRTAEIVADYFKKGKEILLIGSIRTGNYEKGGKRMRAFSVAVNKVYFCGKKEVNTGGFIPIEDDDDVPF